MYSQAKVGVGEVDSRVHDPCGIHTAYGDTVLGSRSCGGIRTSQSHLVVQEDGGGSGPRDPVLLSWALSPQFSSPIFFALSASVFAKPESLADLGGSLLRREEGGAVLQTH